MENGLAVLGEITAVQLFAPGQLEASVMQIEREAREKLAKLDISTAKNREAIASLNHWVARSKTFIDEKRKELVATEKRRLAAIDAEGKVYWNRLEALQKEVTAELDAWKEADKKRVAQLEFKVVEMTGLASIPYAATTADIEALITTFELMDMSNMQEFTSRAELATSQTRKALANALAEAQQRDASAAETKRLKAEAAAREQQERDERIAREARDKAVRDAEAERQRIEADKFAAEARAKQAEAQRVAAEEKAVRDAAEAEERHKQAIAEAAKKADADRIAAEAMAKVQAERAEFARLDAIKAAEDRERLALGQAEREKLAAVEAERLRAEKAIRDEQAAIAAREKDKAHRAEIHSAAMIALASITGVDKEHAKAIVIAIARGDVPHVKINY
jgi:hypothetical protein